MGRRARRRKRCIVNTSCSVLPQQVYGGFEQGPIRPPSESFSLLLRLTRNCPWNQCLFCPVYKGTVFSTRPLEHILRDIDAIHGHVQALQSLSQENGGHSAKGIRALTASMSSQDLSVFRTAFQWTFAGQMKSVFLQDADSLVMRAEDLIAILKHLHQSFPQILRVTCYARSQTLARLRPEILAEIRMAGLDRLHIGLESGSDAVLKRMRKGVTKAVHIEAGRKAKAAGFELSEYVMPGLGGQALSEEHARETADALNQIAPDFIRLRTLALSPAAPLYEDYCSGQFDRCSDLMIARELASMLDRIAGISCTVKSDHVLNLFGEVEGQLPDEKHIMLRLLHTFLDLPPEEQVLFQVGRRLGLFTRLRDLNDPVQRPLAEQAVRRQEITPENVDSILNAIVAQFI